MSVAPKPRVIPIMGSRVGAGMGEHWAPLGPGGLEVSGAALVASGVGGCLSLETCHLTGNPLQGTLGLYLGGGGRATHRSELEYNLRIKQEVESSIPAGPVHGEFALWACRRSQGRGWLGRRIIDLDPSSFLAHDLLGFL
jgi:hypothetical protein